MVNQQLTLQQLEQLKQISDLVARRRYMVLFQLPQDLQNSFESDVTTNSVWNITKEKYNLPDTGVSAVARIIGLIFLGELNIKNFIAALRDELKIDIQKATAIAQDINQAIFQPVRNSLMLVHNITNNNNHNPGIGNNESGIRQESGIMNQESRPQVPSSKFQAPRVPPPVSLDQIETNFRYHQSNPSHPERYGHPEPFASAQGKLREGSLPAAAKRDSSPRQTRVQNDNNRNPINKSPYQARPAMYQVPKKNVVDLRNIKRKRYNKRRYDGFFSA